MILGDFNQIVFANEHYSVLPHDLPLSGMSEFHDCLVSNELQDMPSRGTLYTWSNNQPDDPVLRKLDRVLINEQWSSTYPDSLAVFDPPGDSDHSPILVNSSSLIGKSGKSFKYFSFISTHARFKGLIRDAWQVEVCAGSKLYIFGQRMKVVKVSCKKLNREGFANIQQKTKDALEMLERVQSALLSAPSDLLFREEFLARKSWNFFAKAQESFYRQKSRIRWSRDGDANTAYFHKSVIAHQGTNSIKLLRGTEDERIQNVDQIKDMLVSYYHSLLGTESVGVVAMSIDEVKTLLSFRCGSELSTQLLKVPTVEEIRRVVATMPKNKAPGPDGFPIEFFWEAWEIVGQDLVEAVQGFFISGFLPRNFNATAITLIPKVQGADKLQQFRPVSCCTTVYKIIARLLKQKLKLFISDAVQGNQVGFVQGRHLCENVLLASELVTNFHSEGVTTRGCLQVDLAKAYDNLDWQFLLNVLNAIELPDKFVGWIKECFTTPSFSVAFNGELVGFFQGKKGLRQGDPISSLLFVLAMDVLSKKLDKGVINQSFGPHPLCLVPLITHLSFADDVLIFFDGKEDSLQGVMDILEEFKAESGLGVNKDKTALFLDGGCIQENSEMANRLGLLQGSLPVRYLGVPLTSKKMKEQDYQPLIDRILSRFSSWSVKHLSFAGRLQLIQSVIYSIITFWASIFILPNKCLETIERMCCAFLWKGSPFSARGARVSWESVCTPKSSGGLGLRRLQPWNKVLGLKLIWLLFTAGGSLWVSWVRRNLLGQNNFWEMVTINSGSWIWKSLCKLRPIARPFVVCKIGSGITCNFWSDNWTALGPLLHITGDLGPRITGLPRHATVADALRGNDWWISRSRSRHPIIQLLKECLPSPAVVQVHEEADDDCFLWKVGEKEASCSFSSASTWEHLNPHGEDVDWFKAIWFKGRIPKHAFLAWVTARNRLNTRDRLLSWGLVVPSLCLFCNAHDESRQHLFFDCAFAAEVWNYFTSRAHVNPPSLFEDGLRWLRNPCRDKNMATILRLAFHASIYILWKERNARIHTSIFRPVAALILEIKGILRCHLDPLTRAQRLGPHGVSFLATWFERFLV
ncbi:Reverse transcriptase zinc-binding domain [Arabidopsis suecica]|uniref:Reverse transcriptase zinc-binding domain n=1 Tax=Arabidopsis suecica TaxID=45249 RepID=A0A8T2B7E0_ARASU|nr:Reverse transcriptase zinc-binding domain [Arabidopsis suecica]